MDPGKDKGNPALIPPNRTKGKDVIGPGREPLPGRYPSDTTKGSRAIVRARLMATVNSR
jgi:hypothetical protein